MLLNYIICKINKLKALALNLTSRSQKILHMKQFIPLFVLISFFQIATAQQVLYPVYGKSKWYYIDAKAAIVLPENFTIAGPFVNSVAIASDKAWSGLFDPSVGLLKADGTWLVAPEYDKIMPFVQGVALAKRNGKWGGLNSEGKTQVPFLFEEVKAYGDEMLAFKSKGLWGFSDVFGNQKIPAVYQDVTPFFNGFAVVKQNGKWGLINKAGETVLPFTWIDATAFTDNRCGIKFEGGLFGFVDNQGAKITQNIYDNVFAFSEERAAFRSDGLWGFLNPNGEVAVKAFYSRVKSFSEGLASVQYKGKWGYINRNGKVVIPAIYTEAEDFINGMAQVKRDGIWYYIDVNGNRIISFKK